MSASIAEATEVIKVRDVILEVLNQDALIDTDDIVRAVNIRIPDSQLRTALSQLVTEVVLTEMARQDKKTTRRGRTPGTERPAGQLSSTPSANRRLRGMQGLAATLRTHYQTESGYKPLGDMNASDLDFAVADQEETAARSLARAAQLRTVRGLLDEHGVETVRQLPDEVLIRVLA